MKKSIQKNDSYNNLTAIEFSHRDKHNNLYWKFNCSCGKRSTTRVGNVKYGIIKSCGCLKKGINKKHGMKNTKIYGVWHSMKNRCLNKKSPVYKNYGGRGITVCKDWLKFENFYSDMGNQPKNRTLDRIDNNGNYCKENCRWATWIEQANNRRNNRMITYCNKTQNITQWAKELGIKRCIIYERLYHGWTIEKALTK